MKPFRFLTLFSLGLFVSLQSLFCNVPDSYRSWYTGGYYSYSNNKVSHYYATKERGSWVPWRHPVATCKIGSDESPVTMDEYCQFLIEELNSKVSDNTIFSYWFDSNFMSDAKVPNDPLNPSKQYGISAISYNHYDSDQEAWTVLPDHHHDIIDSVQSRWAAEHFAEWRKNPTAQEIKDYAESQLKGDEATTQAIKDRYAADSAKRIFELVDRAVEVAQDPNKQECVIGSYLNVRGNSPDQVPSWTVEYNFADVISFRKMPDNSIQVLLSEKRNPCSRPNSSYYENETHNGKSIFK